MDGLLRRCGYFGVKEKVKKSRNRPGVTQRVSGVSGSQIFMTFST
jgi:hypothetical protein